MPQILPAIAAFATSAIVTLTGSAGLAAFVGNAILASGGFFVSLGLTLASAALAGKPKAMSIVDPGAQLRFQPAPNASRQFVYGETAIAGQIIYQGTTGDDNRYLHIIAALADGGENEGVQSVKFNDEALTIDTGVTDMVTLPSKWAQKARIQYNTGHPSTQTAFSDAVSEITAWTTNHKGLGTALAYIRLDYDPEVWQGVPQPLFIFRGRKVYDPRLDTSVGANPDNATYWAWTANPALWALDYLRGIKSGGTTGDRMGGLGVGNDLIDWQSWNDAADACDANLTVHTGSTPIAQYTGGGGVVSSDDEPLSILEAMAATFAGVITTRSGLVACYAGETQTAAVTLTDDDLAGPINVNTTVSVRETGNAISAQYREPSIGYETQSAPPYRNATWETEDDSEVLWKQMDLVFVDDHRRAQRLAKIFGGNLREPRQIEARYKIKAIQILEGEVFTLDSDSYGSGVNGKFRLLQKTINIDGTVDIVARSETDAKYDWDVGDESAAPTGTTVTGATPTPATPSGWTVVPTDVTGPQGSAVTVLTVTSPGSLPTSTDLVEFQIQRQAGPTLGLDMLGGQFSSASSGAAADASYEMLASLSVAQADQGFKIPNIERSRNYNVRVRYRNGFGAAGSWETISSAVAAAGAATSAPSGWTAASGTITSAEGHTRPVLAVTAPTAGVAEEASQVSIDARKTTDTDYSQQQVMTRADASRGVNLTAEPGVDYIVRVRYGASAESWGPDQQIPVSATATSAVTISGFGLASNSSASGAYSVPGFKASWTALTGDDLQRTRNLEIQYYVTADSTDVTTLYAEPDESSKTVHGLLAGVEYTVRMRASDIFSNGTWTATSAVTVSATWTTGLASSVEWESVLDGSGTIPDDSATLGATWGTDIGSRPTELTDGRVSAGLDASGDLNRNLTTARTDSSNILRRSTGGIYTGALAATAGATWGTDVGSIPTSLSDGRVAAGLDASGDLNRNLTTARTDSSNILRRTTGGIYTGALAATAGATWGTDVGSRPAELTDGRITTGLNSSGVLLTNVPNASQIPNLAATILTSGTLPDARIQASGVTQHEASLTLATSQIPSGISAALLTVGTLPIARIADNAVTLAKMAGGTANQVLAFDGSGNPTELKIGDNNVDTNRGLVEDGSGVPTPTRNRMYSDTSKTPSVAWLDDGTDAIRMSSEQQSSQQVYESGVDQVTTEIRFCGNTVKGEVLAKVVFENVTQVNRLRVVATGNPEYNPSPGDAATDTGTKGQFIIIGVDHNATNADVEQGEILTVGTALFTGSTTAVTFTGSPIEVSDVGDLADAVYDVPTSGVDVLLTDIIPPGGSDLAVYLLMRASSGDIINTIPSSPTELITCLISD